MALVRQLFDTNTIGVMAMCQAVIPQMRARRAGTIVNVTSSVTLGAFPLAAAYTASKQAIEGFTGSLAHELAYFNIRAKLVEPGYAPTTRFASNAVMPVDQLIPDAYAGFAKPIMEAFGTPALTTRESDVAEGVWRAVHDTDGPALPGGSGRRRAGRSALIANDGVSSTAALSSGFRDTPASATKNETLGHADP
jgi:NAD(P)-dependent dehydrogenase (short-subunit alcohol dehydrogenase family)